MASSEKKTDKTKTSPSLKETSTAPALKTGLTQFKDNRPETAQLKMLQEMANNLSGVAQLNAFKKLPVTKSQENNTIIQRAVADEELGDAWGKAEKYAAKKGVELTPERQDAIEAYFSKKSTPSKAEDAMAGAYSLINKWVQVAVQQSNEGEGSKKPGWQKGTKTGPTGNIKPDGEHHTSKGDKSLSKAERNARRDRERRQFGEGGGGRFAE